MPEREFDVIVIGAGPAGEVCAGRLAEHGRSVALVEQELVGGECSYFACMPSKALLRPGELLAEARRIPGVAQAVAGDLDVPAVLARRDEVVHDLDDSAQLPWLQERSVTLVRGHARFAGEQRLTVGDATLLAHDAIVVATGSGPLIPPIPGLRESRPWSNREITTTHSAPARLLILGGGVVGVEMAQAWSSLGSTVTLVEAAPRLIAREEPFASEEVAAALERLGVQLRIGVKASAVSRDGDAVTVQLDDGSSVAGDELLVAIGREPRTRELGLETIDLEPGAAIEVDERLRSSRHPWLYAIGDVNERALLTHMGKYQGRIVADVICGRDTRLRSDGPRSPRVIFTDPQVAAVGLTLALARERGMEVRAVDVPMQSTAGASFYGRDVAGTARIVVEESRRVIVGATFTGPEIAEFLHAATIAVIGEVELERLWHAVPSFPTRSEIWLRLLEAYGL